MAEGHNPDVTIQHDVTKQATLPKLPDTTIQVDEERYIKDLWPNASCSPKIREGMVNLKSISTTQVTNK